MKIVALMPVYKSMYVESVISLTNMLAEVYNRNDHISVLYSMLNNVALGRNSLFKTAIKEDFKDADYIISLDSDHAYDANKMYTLIEKMEANNLQMLSASYNARSSMKLAHLREDEEGTPKLIDPTGLTGIQECHTVGFGFLVMKIGLVKELFEANGGNLFSRLSAHQHGEDVYFCELVRKQGYKVCFDADTKIGHLSTVIL